MASSAQFEFGRERPSNVPPNARWFFESEDWLYCERDASGELHGSVRTYREDGTPWLEYEYRHGKRHGPFRRYHASGQVAQEGRYFDDLLDGLVSFRSDGENTYSIRECCIPPSTRVMRQEHRRGQLLAETYEDERGQVLEEPALGAPGAKGWPEPLREREDQVSSLAFDFWPAREPLSSTAEAHEAWVEQPLLAVRQAIQRSAQRVLLLRRELDRHGMRPDLPDVSPLIAESELPLRRFSFETDGDVGQLTVHVDETIELSQSTRELGVRMRLEWTALCWLCWAVGLDEIALPERIESRPELHAALLTASQRQSVLTGYDLMPSSAQHFHGLDETLLPASALSMIADHYREIRAVLLFLVDVECQSPWQDDLGRAPSAPEI
ncbi:MAG TPA: hypothetical protein VHM25_10555 [Polyangiaceae bacterium]|nr:hypothetical protein [Polyangiaceae bacterium]